MGASGIETFQDLARPGGITCLRGERAARRVRRHAFMRHGPPRVVRGRRLRIPDVAGIACELAALQRPHDGIAVHELRARGVHQVGASFHHPERLVIDHMLPGRRGP